MSESTRRLYGVGSSLILVVVQLAFVPVLVTIVGTPVVLATLRLIELSNIKTSLIDGAVAYLLIVIVGFSVGLGACSAWNSLYPTGSHLWILPTAVYLMTVVFAFASEPPAEVAKALFRISTHEGFGVVFVYISNDGDM
jgi:hypothetical protein